MMWRLNDHTVLCASQHLVVAAEEAFSRSKRQAGYRTPAQVRADLAAEAVA